MSERPSPHSALQIGDWHVDPAAGLLSRHGTVRRLRPQVVDVLLAFARRPAEVISKQELLDIAWPGRFVSESPLTTTIAELRQALDDDAKNPRYIQTVPKRGYRLIAPVRDLLHGAAIELLTPVDVDVETAAPPRAIEASDLSPERLPVVRAAPARPVLFIVTAAALASLVALSLAFTAAVRLSPRVAIPITLESGQQWPSRTMQVATLSPDGRALVYVVETAEGTRQLVRRDLETTVVDFVPGGQGASSPFFSPDGTRIGFFKQGAIRAVDARGREETLVEVSAPFGASWRSNGDLIFAGHFRSGLSLMPAGSHAARPLTVLMPERQEASHRYPAAIPASRFVLFTALGAKTPEIAAVDVTTGERHTVVENSAFARFAAPDRLLFARGSVLLSAPFDPATARTTGRPVEVARNVAFWPQTGLTQFAVSASGVLVYLTEASRIDRELVAVDRAGRVTPLAVDAGPYIHPRVSADGRQVVMWQEVGDAMDVVVLDLASNQLTRITHDGRSARPVWALDGHRLAFDRPSTGSPANVVIAPVSADAPTESLLPRDRVQTVEAWLPDGRGLVISQIEPATSSDLHLVRLDTRQVRPLASAPGPEAGAVVSPDGRWIAYGYGSGIDSSGPSAAIVSTDVTEARRVDLPGAGRELRWSHDGRELFYRAGDAMYALPVHEDDGRLITRSAVRLFRGVFEQRPGFRANYDVLADGRFLMLRRRGGTPPQQIIVSLNWKALN